MAPKRSRRYGERSAWRRARALALAAAACAAGLVPLYGDPRATPVTHPIWARLLLRALDMNTTVRTSARASQVFAALAWRDSLSYPADGFVSARDAVVTPRAGGGVVVGAGELPAEVTYALAVVQPGEYRLRALLAGAPDRQATAELVSLDGGGALDARALPLPGASAWVFGGTLHVATGAYGARFLLPPGCTLSRVEIAPPCLHPIEPDGGWQPEAPTSRADVALTALRAMEREDELAPASTPVELDADAFRVDAPSGQTVRTGLAAPRLEAGRGGLRAVASVALPQAGLYVVSVLAAPGAGQRWRIDGCRSAFVCAGGSVPAWRTLAAQDFSAGRHLLEATLGDGATVLAVRLELKKRSAADYVAALDRLGLHLPPADPVSRATALEAARFVAEQRRAAIAAACVEPLPVAEAVQIAAGVAAAPARPPEPEPAVAPVPPPIDSPFLPPQEPATPTLPGSGS